jgi:phage terminase large subunit-like protein
MVVADALDVAPMTAAQGKPSPAELRATLEALEAIEYRKTFRRGDFWKPYPKQLEFFAMGFLKRERLFMAGNQVGKSDSGAFETMCHATGNYPPWWPGKRFDRPTVGWVAGVSSNDVKRVAQRKLCGPPGVDSEWGTGVIPKEDLLDKAMGRGVTDAIDELQVQHRTNGKKDGVSRIVFKSYEQGRKTFQGDTIDYGWGDEEAEKPDVYPEFLTRLSGSGVIYTTFTPLFGPTDFVNSFRDGGPDKGVITMTLDEVPPAEQGGHFTTEEKAKRLAGYQAHEVDARSKGIPKLGSGAIFATPEEAVVEPPLAHVPLYWAKGWGVDFGIGHPFAAALCAWDREADCVHILQAYRAANTLSIVHAAAMNRLGAGLPVFWPKDGADRDPHGGDPLKDGYKKHGLKMYPEHAHWPDGSLSTEAGITEWDEREKSDGIKFAAHLSELLEERRYYHRKVGKIVKIRDDILSAVRIFLMMKRYAKAGPILAGRPGIISIVDPSDPRNQFAIGSPLHPDGEYPVFG